MIDFIGFDFLEVIILTSLNHEFIVSLSTASNNVVKHNKNEASVKDKYGNKSDPTKSVIIFDVCVQSKWIVEHDFVDEKLLAQTGNEEQKENDFE